MKEIDITNLDGAALLDALFTSDAKPVVKGAKRGRKSKDRNGKRKELNKQFLLEQENRKLAPVDTTTMTKGYWRATALVLAGVVWTCSCGAKTVAPNAEAALIRYEHRRNGKVEYKPAEHLSFATSHLPRKRMLTHRKCYDCPCCWPENHEWELAHDTGQLCFDFPFPKIEASEAGTKVSRVNVAQCDLLRELGL